MKSALPAPAMRAMKYIAIPVVAVVIGLAIAIASSPASLSRGHVLGTPAPPSPSPTAVTATPVPSVTAPGILGKAPQLVAAGTQSIAGLTPNLAVGSADDGKTWTGFTPPAKASGVAIDPGNPQHGVTGGSSINVTVDGGVTWKPVQVPPPAGGPYVPLEVSSFDGNVWFFVHGGKLLRTRDAGATWRDIPGLPALSAPALVAGQVFGQFYLGSGGSVFELIDNGQQVVAQPSLPSDASVSQLAAVGGGQANLFARGSNKSLYLLTNGTWSVVSGTPSGPIGAAGGALVVGDGRAELGSPGAAVYSNDGGASWRPAAGLPYDQSVEAIAGQATSSTLFAYCYGGDVYSSADGGRDWILFSRGLRSKAG